MVDPAPRNVQHNSDWCAYCLNAGGVDAVYSQGSTPRYGVCGDPWNAPKHHESTGKYGFTKISRRYAKGKTISVRVVLTANHLGRWSVRLCPLSSSSAAAEQKELTATCLQALQRADGSGPYTYVPGDQYNFKVKYRLPRNVSCERCVLQWLYETGNTCRPPGCPKKFTGTNVGTCGSRGNRGELFVNCADVQII